MSYLSLNSWSLHRNLGPLLWTVWDDAQKKQIIQVEPQPETIKLLDLPAKLASKGFKAMKVLIFIFQVPTDTIYKNFRNEPRKQISHYIPF